MFVLAILLVGLLVLLATLQYRWLGQISQADRDRRRASLTAGASEFAQDVDRELTRAYLLFQTEPGGDSELAARFAVRYDHWQATSRFPRLLKDFYVFAPGDGDTQGLRRFDPATRAFVQSEWPDSMRDWRRHLGDRDVTGGDGSRTLFIARVSRPIWESVPAIVAPLPLPFVLFPDRPATESRVKSLFSYAVLALDIEYLKRELLPALVERHFRGDTEGVDFQIAVVRTAGDGEVVYSSSREFAPKPDAEADATADLLQVRTQDFTSVAAEVRRYTTFAATVHTIERPGSSWQRAGDGRGRTDVLALHDQRPLSILVQPGSASSSALPQPGSPAGRMVASNAGWRLLLKHPAGSLEAAVLGARRRNLAVSMSVLGVLGASMGLLVLSTRRAQRLARQQMEFVAAVSHELRTPLAVIRSAAENLADGVVRDDQQIRQYGDLVRTEGRRLTEMVEQILELAGIQSGQRGFALRAVRVEGLLQDIIASSAALIESAGMQVQLTVTDDLPPVLGDEHALRRVFQNLIGNALKYGAGGGWIGLSAARAGSDVRIVVADRGLGVAPAEQARIFEPFYRGADAIEARIQGAGLGLSLVQRIVEAHGGRVSVKSAPGTGSEFIVHLPSAGEEPLMRRVGAAYTASATADGRSDPT
jgi:signal transduction histidine kinase